MKTDKYEESDFYEVEGPIKATFEFDDEKLGPVTYTCELDRFALALVCRYQEMTVDGLLSEPLVCFQDTINGIKLKDAMLVERPNGKFGTFRRKE